jgi:hypothetical protein
MSDTLRKTIGNMPQILHKNAKSMMQRMIDAMQEAIAADPHLGPSSYCALLLKMSSGDLGREYERALGESLGTIRGAGAGSSSQWLSIEPLEAAAALSAHEFEASTALFEKLRSRVNGLGIKGLSAYGKDLFLAALKEAFDRSGIDLTEVEKLMPLARRLGSGG